MTEELSQAINEIYGVKIYKEPKEEPKPAKIDLEQETAIFFDNVRKCCEYFQKVIKRMKGEK